MNIGLETDLQVGLKTHHKIALETHLKIGLLETDLNVGLQTNLKIGLQTHLKKAKRNLKTCIYCIYVYFQIYLQVSKYLQKCKYTFKLSLFYHCTQNIFGDVFPGMSSDASPKCYEMCLQTCLQLHNLFSFLNFNDFYCKRSFYVQK